MRPTQMKIAFAAVLGVLCCGVGIRPAAAQDEAFISLNMENTALQTGEVYEVQIVVENVRDLWVTSVEISYDPDLVYVIGTRSGSPVQPGPLLPANQILVPRNRIERDTIRYTASLLAPAEPINGTGVLATFQIAPLASGSAQLLFRSANLTAVSFEQGAQGRVAGAPQTLAFTPVLLALSIQGDPVEPPPEVTATPPPTSTPILEETAEVELATAEVEATLINITRAPASVPTPADEPPESGPSPVLIGAAALLAISAVGLLALAVVYRRRYRR